MPDPIPLIDAALLFGRDSRARADCDAAIREAARDPGFLVLEGLPDELPLGPAARRALLRIFSLPADRQRRLWRNAWAKENPNVYRGFFPLSAGIIKHGIDIGPDSDASAGSAREGDALAEPTPLPEESVLPGFLRDVRASFRGLERIAGTLMHALARGLGLREDFFDDAFRGGNSTLRVIAYPPWPELAAQLGWPLRPLVSSDGVRRYDIGGEHVDSGLVTLLQQDPVGGLQARVDEEWLDVPPVERSLVVNFGKLLERWTGGRIRATEHRVLGNDRERCSIPFFYEPRIDARIAPLPLEGAARFEPFRYGDHLWQAISGFAEFAHARRFPEGRAGALHG